MEGYCSQPTAAQGWLAFVCEDDVWVVSLAAAADADATAAVARRVTSGGGGHGGRCSSPLFSPSGRLLAYTNSHSGAHELCVVPFDPERGVVTGASVQLTLSSASWVLDPCRAVTWSSSEKEVIFSATARRGRTYTWDAVTLHAAQIPSHLLSSEKSSEEPWHALPRTLGVGASDAAAIDASGSILMLGRYTRDCHVREWKHYRGGKQGQCWVDPGLTGDFSKLRTYLGDRQGEREVLLNIASPFVAGDRLYFIADPSSVELADAALSIDVAGQPWHARGNLFSVRWSTSFDVMGTGLKQHSLHCDHYARNASAVSGGDGGTPSIVYQSGGRLFLARPNLLMQDPSVATAAVEMRSRELAHCKPDSSTAKALSSGHGSTPLHIILSSGARSQLLPHAIEYPMEYVEEASIHPQGHSLTVICRGMAVTMPIGEGPAVQLGADSGDQRLHRYSLCEYLCDGRLILGHQVVIDAGAVIGKETFIGNKVPVPEIERYVATVLELHRPPVTEEGARGLHLGNVTGMQTTETLSGTLSCFGVIEDAVACPTRPALALTNHRHELIVVEFAPCRNEHERELEKRRGEREMKSKTRAQKAKKEDRKRMEAKEKAAADGYSGESDVEEELEELRGDVQDPNLSGLEPASRELRGHGGGNEEEEREQRDHSNIDFAFRVVDRSDWDGGLSGISWSPCGRWICYGAATSQHTSQIRICDTRGPNAIVNKNQAGGGDDDRDNELSAIDAGTRLKSGRYKWLHSSVPKAAGEYDHGDGHTEDQDNKDICEEVLDILQSETDKDALDLSRFSYAVHEATAAGQFRDRCPTFGGDGRFLFFVSSRYFGSTLREDVLFEQGMGFTNPSSQRIFLLALRTGEPNPFERRAVAAADLGDVEDEEDEDSLDDSEDNDDDSEDDDDSDCIDGESSTGSESESDSDDDDYDDDDSRNEGSHKRRHRKGSRQNRKRSNKSNFRGGNQRRGRGRGGRGRGRGGRPHSGGHSGGGVGGVSRRLMPRRNPRRSANDMRSRHRSNKCTQRTRTRARAKTKAKSGKKGGKNRAAGKSRPRRKWSHISDEERQTRGLNFNLGWDQRKDGGHPFPLQPPHYIEIDASTLLEPGRVMALPLPAGQYSALEGLRGRGRARKLMYLRRSRGSDKSGDHTDNPYGGEDSSDEEEEHGSAYDLFSFDVGSKREKRLVEKAAGFSVSLDGRSMLVTVQGEDNGGEVQLLALPTGCRPASSVDGHGDDDDDDDVDGEAGALVAGAGGGGSIGHSGYGQLYFGVGRYDEVTGNVGLAPRLGALLKRPKAEFPQMLDEAWASLAQHFYDPDMHGVDWLAVRRVLSLPLLALVGCRSELSDVLMEMMTELGVSHLSERSGDFHARYTPEERGNGRGSLCADVKWVESATAGRTLTAESGHSTVVLGGGFEITSVVRGDDWCPARAGPLARLGVCGRVNPGDVIVAINARRLTPSLPPERVLEGCEGMDVFLTVVTNYDPHAIAKKRIKRRRWRERRWREQVASKLEKVASDHFANGDLKRSGGEQWHPRDASSGGRSDRGQRGHVGRVEKSKGKGNGMGNKQSVTTLDPRGISKAERRAYDKRKAVEKRRAVKEKKMRNLRLVEFGGSSVQEAEDKEKEGEEEEVLAEREGGAQGKGKRSKKMDHRGDFAQQRNAGAETELLDSMASLSLTNIAERKARPRDLVLRTIRVRAVSRLAELGARYRDWVTQKSSLVSTLTRGQCGYVHVPDMDRGGYIEFHRQFFLAAERPALIVDVRGNFGGFVSELLLEKLQRRRLAANKPRYGRAELYPAHAPSGAMVMIADEQSSSDGDCIAFAFRQLGLGKVVGTRTWGGTVGISSSVELVDGTSLQHPDNSFCSLLGKPIIENVGVVPDVEVTMTPQDHVKGRDPQLEKAVDVIVELLTKAE